MTLLVYLCQLILINVNIASSQIVLTMLYLKLIIVTMFVLQLSMLVLLLFTSLIALVILLSVRLFITVLAVNLKVPSSIANLSKLVNLFGVSNVSLAKSFNSVNYFSDTSTELPVNVISSTVRKPVVSSGPNLNTMCPTLGHISLFKKL